MRWTNWGVHIGLVAATIVLLLMPSSVKQPAHAAIFVVNSTADLPDNNTGDGVCQTPLNTCTLRAAIQQANALPGADVIHFSIGTGLQTITPTATLPTITGTLVIDGTTQPGYVNTPIIVLSGTGAGNVIGLTLSAGNSTIRGLVINQFDIGISIQNDDTENNFIVGNFIGTTATGLAPAPNRTAGIRLSNGAANNTIGGTLPADRNIISGNTGVGILVTGTDTEPNTITGNFVGTDLTGTLIDPSPIVGDELGNGSFGISVIGGADRLTISGNVISGNDDGIRFSGGGVANHQVIGNFIGTDATGNNVLPNRGNGVNILNGAQRIQIDGSNVIAGNALNGIHIQSSASAVTIQNNFIGTNTTQSPDLGNALNGVYLSYSNANRPGENIIGGFGANAGNVIAFNGQAGVRIDYPNQPTGNSPYTGAGNTISSNSIFENGGLGIDLVWLNAATGPTLNDPSPDADNGPNDLQNFPNLLRASTNSLNATAIQGSLTTRPNLQVRVEFFNSPTCDPSGFGEGATFLGFYNGTTDSAGVLNFNLTLPIGVPVGSVMSAITIAQTVPSSNFRNTSEFSPCLTAISTSNLALSKTDSADPILVGDNLTYTLIVSNTGPEVAMGVILSDPLPSGTTFIDSLPSAPTCLEAGGVVTCNLGNLAAGGVATVQIEINVTASNNLLNTASVTSSDLESNYLDNTASQTTNVLTETATPTHTATAATATLLSQTPTAASSSATTVPTFPSQSASPTTLPSSTSTITLPSSPTVSATTTRTATASRTSTFTSTPSRTALRTPSPTRITASPTPLSTSTPIPPLPSATVVLPPSTVTPIPLEIAKEPVDEDTYTITISNPGVAYVTQLLLTEQLRPGMSFISSDPSAPTCHQLDGRITCQLGTLAGGASMGVQIEVDPAGLELLSGQTTVQANGQTVASVDRPYIAKFASPGFVEPGAEIIWTIQVINPTNRVASNVQVVDVIPAQFEILEASSTQGTISRQGQQVTLRLAVLAPVDALTITIQTRLNTEVENPVIPNRACLTTREFPTQRCAEISLLRVRTLPATGQSYWGQWRLPILVAGLMGVMSATLLLWRLKYRRRISRAMQ
ncbi:MAG: DUF11 domain-containing protein [Chloroflexi bacterium]|nr:DUF11 domain-containing protein [Chloroflexota bacterium]